MSFVMLCAPHCLRADDVSEHIQSAARHYARGEMSSAAAALEYAAERIREARSAALLRFLPHALKGWTASDGAGEVVGAQGLGGGSTAAREYQQGENLVIVSIAADGAPVQAALAMLSNPVFATSDGGRLERVAQQPAIVKYNAANRSGVVTIVVGQRFLVTITGTGVDQETLRAYANGVDVAGLNGFT